MPAAAASAADDNLGATAAVGLDAGCVDTQPVRARIETSDRTATMRMGQA
jgi:hypothetical protein